MTEQKRVSDDRLAELQEDYSGTYLEDLDFFDERCEIAASLSELQARRAQRCETCDYHNGDLAGRTFTRAICDRFSTKDYLHTGEMAQGCSWWQSKEQMPLDTEPDPSPDEWDEPGADEALARYLKLD